MSVPSVYRTGKLPDKRIIDLADTFAGIRAEDVLCFIAAQIAGALLATSLFQRIFISDI